MNMKKTTLATAIGLVFGGAAFSANAGLTSSATMSFTLGTVQTTSCILATAPPCDNTLFNVTDIVGSYFVMDNGDGIPSPPEKTGIGSFNGIHIGSLQAAGGSHSGSINGTELPNIDSPWTFFGGTGMHQTTTPITELTHDGSFSSTLDMSGWNVNWNGITSIPLVQQGAANVVCDLVSCSDSSNYTLDATFHVSGAGFTTVTYFLHLEGDIKIAAVPVPAAAWLFGSGLLGLVGVARRRKNKKA